MAAISSRRLRVTSRTTRRPARVRLICVSTTASPRGGFARVARVAVAIGLIEHGVGSVDAAPFLPAEEAVAVRVVTLEGATADRGHAFVAAQETVTVTVEGLERDRRGARAA